MKSFFNFLAIVILCIASLGLPLNYDAFVYDASIPWQNNGDNDVNFTVTLLDQDTNNKIVNPNTVTVVITSDKETEVEFDNTLPLTVEVFQENQSIETLDLEIKNNYDNQSKVTVSQDSPLKYTLDFSSFNTGLDNGEYTFVITSSNSKINNNTKSPLSVDISYSQAVLNYTPAAKTIPSGSKFITAYYIDGTYNNFLVPVTTTVPNSQQTIMAMLHQIRSIPNEGWGLLTRAPFDPINNINKYNLTKNPGIISFSSKTLNPSDNQRLNHLALESLLKTLSGYSHLREVQFLVDDQNIDSILNGISIKDPFTISRGPSIYLALENIKDERLLLIDYNNSNLSSLSPNQAAVTIIDTLKSGITVDDHWMYPTIPSNVTVNNISAEGKVLNIDFSSEILDAYKDDQARQTAMMDSIILSLKSISDITTVNISVNNNKDLSLGGWDLSKPISATLGVNPLK